MRLGYLVAPAALAEIVGRAIPFLEPAASTVAQAALARFIADGHFAVHLRRMRQLYSERQAVLIAAAERHLGGRIALAPEEAGMHLVGYPIGSLAEAFDDTAYVDAAARAGIALVPLSRYYAGATKRYGLIFGYAGVAPPVIETAMARLAGLLLTPRPAPAKSAEPRQRAPVRMRSGKRQAAR